MASSPAAKKAKADIAAARESEYRDGMSIVVFEMLKGLYGKLLLPELACQRLFGAMRPLMVDESDRLKAEAVVALRAYLEADGVKGTKVEEMEEVWQSEKKIAIQRKFYGPGWAPPQWRAVEIGDEAALATTDAMWDLRKAIVVAYTAAHPAPAAYSYCSDSSVRVHLAELAARACNNVGMADDAQVIFEGCDDFKSGQEKTFD